MPSAPTHRSTRDGSPARSSSATDAPPVALTLAIERDAARLEAALRELTRIYERLVGIGERRRSAVRSASHRALQDALAEEAGAAGLASRADRDRSDAARALVRAVGLEWTPDVTASAIASRLPEPWRERIECAASALRAVLERAKEHNQADRLAAETIAAHLEGVLRSAALAAGGAPTYGSRGAIAPRREQVVSVMDLTT